MQFEKGRLVQILVGLRHQMAIPPTPRNSWLQSLQRFSASQLKEYHILSCMQELCKCSALFPIFIQLLHMLLIHDLTSRVGSGMGEANGEKVGLRAIG